MTEPEERQEKTPKTDAILNPPTANPRRTRVSAEDMERQRVQREQKAASDEQESPPVGEEER